MKKYLFTKTLYKNNIPYTLYKNIQILYSITLSLNTNTVHVVICDTCAFIAILKDNLF